MVHGHLDENSKILETNIDVVIFTILNNNLINPCNVDNVINFTKKFDFYVESSHHIWHDTLSLTGKISVHVC